jgi:hypothetical protein
MYCPTCGIQATDNATFCRGCGSNLAIVSQALTGTLVPATAERNDDRKRKKPRTLVEGFTTIFTGLAFVLAAFATLFYAPAGRLWWYWLFIPAFSCLGSGIAMIVEIKLGQRPPATRQVPVPPAPNTSELAAGESYRITAPPSVVEATTRQLDRKRESSK